MHTYTLTGPTLREAFRAGLLPARPTQDTYFAGLRTVQERFTHAARKNTHAVLKSLADGKLKTRVHIGKEAGIGTGAARHEADKLFREGVLERKIEHGAFHYRLTSQHGQAVRRADGQLARYCDCGAYVRFRRYKGTYVFNCRACGVRYFDDSPIGGA